MSGLQPGTVAGAFCHVVCMNVAKAQLLFIEKPGSALAKKLLAGC